MKFTVDRPWSDPEKAARKLLEIANVAEAVQDGRIYIERINALFREHATPAEYSACLKLAIERGWCCTRADLRQVYPGGRRSVRLKSEQLRFCHHLWNARRGNYFMQ
jgi:hypothetical protein